MKAFDKFKKRMVLNGQSTKDRLVRQSRRVAKNKFKTSPSFDIVDVDGKLTEVIVNRTNDYDIKLIHFHYDYRPIVGSNIKLQEDVFILMEKDRDVVYSFGKMERCNSTFRVQVGKAEKIQIGTDDRGRPVYDLVAKYKNEPCIIRDKYYSSNDNASLPLPEGKVDIFMKYQQADNLAVNEEFDLHGKKYKISDVSYVGVVNSEGVMRIHAERREEKVE